MVTFIPVKLPLKKYLLKHTTLNPWMPVIKMNELGV